MEFGQLFVVDRGLASFTRYVHYDQNMALVTGHALLHPVNIDVVELVDGGRRAPSVARSHIC